MKESTNIGAGIGLLLLAMILMAIAIDGLPRGSTASGPLMNILYFGGSAIFAFCGTLILLKASTKY